MTTVTVRTATQDDAEAVRAVGLAAWPATYGFAGPAYVEHGLATWWSPDAVRASIRTTTTLVAETRGASDGALVVVGMGNLDLSGEVPVVWKLYVHPQHQGVGVGGALLDALVAAVPADRGAVRLEHVDGNSRAAGFYARHGFTELRRESRAGEPDQVWLELRLT